MEVAGGHDSENRNVRCWNKGKGTHQHWDLVYAQDMERFINPGKGQLNYRYSVYVDRPFHIISQLPSRRYLTAQGNNMVIKAPNGSKNQVWYFEGKSLTIKNKKTGTSVTMGNQGRNRNMRLSATNGRWF